MERMVVMMPCVTRITVQWELLAVTWMHHWYGYLHVIEDMFSWFISSWFGEDGFYDAMGDLVPQLSGSFWH